jgi:hypothetical protein
MHDLLRAAPPLLDQPTTMEDPGNQRVAKAGGVVPLEFGHGDAGGQQAKAGDFQPVIVDGDENRPTGDRVIAVAERIDQRLAQSQRRVEEWPS